MAKTNKRKRKEMTCFRHKWQTFGTVKRECVKCGKKQINLWGYWSTIKTKRDLELYEGMKE